MDDLSEKLAGILNDPESMERVKKIAESILGEDNSKPTASPFENIGEALGGEEISAIISIITKLKSSGNDPRSQLLTALKPHLSSPRQEKVDTAIKILKMLEIMPLIKDSGIIKF